MIRLNNGKKTHLDKQWNSPMEWNSNAATQIAIMGDGVNPLSMRLGDDAVSYYNPEILKTIASTKSGLEDANTFLKNDADEALVESKLNALKEHSFMESFYDFFDTITKSWSLILMCTPLIFLLILFFFTKTYKMVCLHITKLFIEFRYEDDEDKAPDHFDEQQKYVWNHNMERENKAHRSTDISKLF